MVSDALLRPITLPLFNYKSNNKNCTDSVEVMTNNAYYCSHIVRNAIQTKGINDMSNGNKLSEHELFFDRVFALINKKSTMEGSNFRFSYELEHRPRAIVDIDKGKDGVDSEIFIELKLYIRDIQERTEGKILVYSVSHTVKDEVEFAQRRVWIRPILETVYMEAMIIMMTLSLQNISEQIKTQNILNNGTGQDTEDDN